jgi:hypothetical protein
MNDFIKNQPLNNKLSSKPFDKGTVKIEINLAKWASFIFAPSETGDRVRQKQWTVLNPETGQKTIGRITVNTFNGTTLKPYDYKILLGIHSLWWDKQQLTLQQTTPFRLRELAKALGMKWGRGTLEGLKESLIRLKRVHISWIHAFKDIKKGTLAKIEDDFTILDRLRIASKEKLTLPLTKGKKYELVIGEFRFHEYIENNLRNGGIKPVLFETIKHIHGEISITLYAFLDLVMADKTHWERRTIELLKDDLFVLGKYTKPSDRLRLLQRATDRIQGKPISTGTIHILFEKTKDGQDYKLVVRKEPFKKELPVNHSILPAEELNGLVEQILEFTKDENMTGFCYKIIGELGPQKIHSVLSEIKEADQQGRIQKNRASYFIDLCERYAGRKNLSLGENKKETNSKKSGVGEKFKLGSGIKDSNQSKLKSPQESPDMEENRISFAEIKKFNKELFGR